MGPIENNGLPATDFNKIRISFRKITPITAKVIYLCLYMQFTAADFVDSNSRLGTDLRLTFCWD